MFKPILLGLAGGLCLTTPAQAGLLYERDEFNSFSRVSSENPKEGCCKHSVQVSDLNTSNKFARFELRKADPDTNSGKRAELNWQRDFNNGKSIVNNSETYIGFRIFIPSSRALFPNGPRNIATLLQLKPRLGSPSLSMDVKNNKFFFGTRYGQSSNGDGRSQGFSNDRLRIRRGEWIKFVIHSKNSNGSDGFLKVYRNGNLVLNAPDARIGFDENVSYQFKMGIYSNQLAENRIVTYLDSLTIGDRNSSVTKVTP